MSKPARADVETVTTEQFEAALDQALYRAMTEGVPLMNRGEPVLDEKGKPIMVTPSSDILSVAERRAKAKRSGQGAGAQDQDLLRIIADANEKARGKGGAIPDMAEDDEDGRE